VVQRTQAHQDLEWFRSPECNTLRPLFFWITKLEEVVCVD
jgi:hypothetical protein